MRRARFYILVLGLTLLPQVVAASDLVRWLASQGQVVLGLSVPGLLLALNLPMMAEILRRKKQARLPRFLAATLQAPWTAWWLGSLFYAILRAGWTVAHLGHAPMPIPLAAAPFALSLYGTLFGARVLRREKVTIPVAGLPEGWRGARIVQLSDLHAGRHVTKERLRAIARRAARAAGGRRNRAALAPTEHLAAGAGARGGAAAFGAYPWRPGGVALAAPLALARTVDHALRRGPVPRRPQLSLREPGRGFGDADGPPRRAPRGHRADAGAGNRQRGPRRSRHRCFLSIARLTPMRIHLFELTGAAAAAEERLVRMEPRARDELARQAQRRASELGLMRGPSPIPLVLSPCALPREELAALGRGAHLITSALVKIAREVIERRPQRARLLFCHLSPMESAALAARCREAGELLQSRIDWFVDADGNVRALEVNATIPAMQVYSDAAARGWAEAVAPAHAQALQRNPRNANWLPEALLAAARHRAKPPSIQLLHRDGDPQVAELRALAAMLRDRGIDARTCTPADIALDAGPHGVIYRHLFARYAEPPSPPGQPFLDPVRHGIWNPVDGWLETKGLLSRLSMYTANP